VGARGRADRLGGRLQPILTGRENIYVNASVLGLSRREIDAAFDGIVEFAEIGDFLDTPVQNYSSGMAVRLGFAVASSLQPDILLVDEVLAVGDYQFALKCYRRIGELLHRGTAVILVSHQMQTVANFATRAALMDRGRLTLYEDVDEAITRYKHMAPAAINGPAPVAPAGTQVRVRHLDEAGDGRLHAARPCRFEFTVYGMTAAAEAFCEVTFKDAGGNVHMREQSGTSTLVPDCGPDLYCPIPRFLCIFPGS
jgi:ABC-type multidrug transport system ATPase subunit